MHASLKVAGFIAVALTAATSAHAEKLSSPWDVTAVRQGLIEAGVAFEITENCTTAKVKAIKGLSFLYGLNRTAKKAGFSTSQVSAFVNDPAHNATLEKIVWTRLAGYGATKGNNASVCAAAKEEAKLNTLASTLFRIES